MKLKLSCLIVFLIFGSVGLVWAQSTGDFRSSATGNWNDYTKWQRYNGSSWVGATSGQIPDENANVYVQSGHIISLTQAQKCKDLHIAKGTSSSNATNGRVQLATYSLELYGKLRTYYAAVGTVPGTSTNVMANMLITCTGSSGKLVVKGSSNRTLVSGTEWSDGTFTSPPTGQQLFNMEVSPDAGVEIAMNATIRAYSWNITSGTLNLATSSIIHADTNVQYQGNVTVGVNATLLVNATSSAISIIRRSSGNRGGTFLLNGVLKVMGTDTAIAMSTVTLNGTVEYAMNGAQNFIKNGGDSAVMPDPCNNVIISGSGTKTLAINTTINGTLTRAGTASLALSTFTLTYGSSSTLIYAGSSTQTTANTEWPATGGPRNVIINNTNGVTLNGGKTTAGNLTLLAGTLAMGANALNIQGTTYITGGSYTGGTGYTDGYDDLLNNYFTIGANDINMSNFSGSSAYAANWPLKVDRNWVISGSFSGAKILTLYWTSTDDQNYDWVGLSTLPSAYLNGGEISPIGYDVSGSLRYVTVSVSSFGAKGTFQVGPANDQTLPIELSSFTATATSQYFVQLHWVTQSETDALGYMIFRSEENDLENAIQVSPLINATNTTTQASYQYTDTEVTAGIWYYWLQSIDLNGAYNFHGPVLATVTTDQGGEAPPIPLSTGIAKVFPNPFNPSVTIKYDLKDASPVTISIYNSRGQLVRSFDFATRNPGTYDLIWDANGLSAGIYLIRMQAGKVFSHGKAVLSK